MTQDTQPPEAAKTEGFAVLTHAEQVTLLTSRVRELEAQFFQCSVEKREVDVLREHLLIEEQTYNEEILTVGRRMASIEARLSDLRTTLFEMLNPRENEERPR